MAFIALTSVWQSAQEEAAAYADALPRTERRSIARPSVAFFKGAPPDENAVDPGLEPGFIAWDPAIPFLGNHYPPTATGFGPTCGYYN